MTMPSTVVPTVARLCAALGPALRPVDGFVVTSDPVQAVHISELLDPTVYLSGAELLLTTGLALPADLRGCRAYVRRLSSFGITALAIGLGPAHEHPPEPLVRACLEEGLCLLQVPEPTPFLDITRAYWDAVHRSSEKGLTDALSAQRHLVAAATSKSPIEEISAVVARALGGWAALLDPDGSVHDVSPKDRRSVARRVGHELVRLDVAGIVNSSASFPIDDDVVVVFPLAVDDRVVGHLAVGTRAGLDVAQRHVVLTACALLTLDAVRRREAEAAGAARTTAIAIAADLGEPELARRLAARLGASFPDAPVRVVTALSSHQSDVATAMRRWSPGVISVPESESRSWHLLPEVDEPFDRLEELISDADPRAVVSVSEPVDLARVSQVRRDLRRREAGLEPGTFSLPHEAPVVPGQSELTTGLDALHEASRSAELVQALGAYLRHAGRWEDASRGLGVHRNTLRHRIARCQAISGLDLDDPDVRAALWLLMRGRGDV